MQTVRVKCSSCGGTGLYRGMCEGPGEAVVCVQCNGTGAQDIQYEKFYHRETRPDVTSIRLSRGSFIPTGVGGHGQAMTYAEFEKKFPDPGCGLDYP